MTQRTPLTATGNVRSMSDRLRITATPPPTPLPVPPDTLPPGEVTEAVVEKELKALQIAAANFGTRCIVDANVRETYAREIKEMSRQTLDAVHKGEITPRQAAEYASGLRNYMLEQMRNQDSELGRAYAESLKLQGRSLEQEIEKRSMKLFGREASALSAAERDQVYLAVVEGAGRAQKGLVDAAPYIKGVGRAAVVLTVGISVYNVATAQDKVEAGRREVIATGGGFVGGAAGGAIAGLACGPGAPVCSGVGVLVGGLLGALGTDAVDRAVNPRPEDAPLPPRKGEPTPQPPPTPTPEPRH